jgi:hypothetical protein
MLLEMPWERKANLYPEHILFLLENNPLNLQDGKDLCSKLARKFSFREGAISVAQQ